MEFDMLGFLLIMGFIAAFIDAAVGGGGLISIPALMCTGLPPITVLGTNKLAAVMGALSSFIAFIRSGKMDISLVKKLFPISLIGSFLGVLLVQQVSPEFLRPFIIVMLIVVFLYSLLKKEWDRDTKPQKIVGTKLYLCFLLALVMGVYDGFFGPGTGSFLLFRFLMIGFDFLGATANTKALNFASNIAATLLFCYQGIVDYSYGIPMGISMIIGAHCGAKFAISKGVTYVRPLFIIVTALLIGKQILTLLG